MEHGEAVRAALGDLVAGEDEDRSWQERVQPVLAAASEALEVDNAHLTKIDQAANYWRATASGTAAAQFPPSPVLPLRETFCREALERETVAITDPASEGWAEHPAFQTHDVATYLGVPMRVGGRTSGTLCFVAEEPRKRPFTTEQLLLAELLGTRLAYERDSRRSGEQLDHLEAFVSTMSHDFRNPLNVARGWVETEQANRESDPLDRALAALGRLEDLLEDGVRLAREAEPVIETEPVSLRSVAEKSWRRVQTHDAALEISADPTFAADPDRLVLLFEKLFQNAIDHGGEAVTVTVEPLRDEDGIAVEDDGPGIPAEYRERVFDQGFSMNGSNPGLGLSIVAAIATAHEWAIRAVEGADGGARIEIIGIAVAQ